MKKKTTRASTRRSRKGSIKDLTPKADPKGGAAFDAFLEIGGIDGESEAKVRLPGTLKYRK